MFIPSKFQLCIFDSDTRLYVKYILKLIYDIIWKSFFYIEDSREMLMQKQKMVG